MSSTSARTVRIAKRPAPPEVRSSVASPEQPPVAAPPPAEPSGQSPPQVQHNTGGRRRSWRFFLLGYVFCPLLLWAVFATLVLRSSEWQEPAGPLTLESLTALVALIVVAGFLLTVLRTPKAFSLLPGGRLSVTTPLGGRQVLDLGDEAYQISLETYPSGLLAREPTELVELVRGPHSRKRWIVQYRLLDPFVGRRPASTPGSLSKRMEGELDRVDAQERENTP